MSVSLPPGWRPMREADRPMASALAKRVHADYPEDDFVLAERLRLFPDGCLVLEGDGFAGYVVSHPWLLGKPPKLNSALGALPDAPSTYYIHDLALAPQARGTGAARAIVEHLAERAQADGFDNLSLVSVGASGPFWERCGFAPVDSSALTAALASYDGGARYLVRPLSGFVRD